VAVTDRPHPYLAAMGREIHPMASHRRSIPRWIVLAALLLALVLFARQIVPSREPAWRSAASSKASLRHDLPVSRPTPVDHRRTWRPFPPGAPELRVGLLMKNIYNLQLESQTFSADGWYWLEWDDDLERILRDQSLKPDQLVEFANQVEAWDSQIDQETADAQRLGDGSRYQLFRFSARFYIDAIDERHSPFETVVLPVVVETRPEAFALSRAAVRLRPADTASPLTGDYSELAGYSLKRNWIVEGQNAYEMIGPRQDEVYSQLAFRVAYGSEPWASFMKWILPLLIVMTIVLLAPSLESSLGEMRLAIPSTALLTLVFLQQTYKAELPTTPYLTFLDELYAYSYLVAVGLFILFLWGSNRMESAPPAQRPEVQRSINRIDSLCQWGALLGLGVVAVLAWFL
jgi:hypothetical protein